MTYIKDVGKILYFCSKPYKFTEDTWTDLSRPITTFYNSHDVDISTAELLQTKTGICVGW